ncbi:type I-B CRISPR-associated endonuclease Cas1 [bacterium]|nr:type I-B CRISPR-associated endonuclease Cas1 [bacterium]
MKNTIYIFSGGELKRKQNTIFFETEEGKKFVPVENTSEIMIFGEVTLNKKLLDFFSQKEIILHFFNYYGYYSGSYYPREHHNSGYMILKQAEHYMDPQKRLVLAKEFVIGSGANLLRNLNYYRNREVEVEPYIEKIEDYQTRIDEADGVEKLMALEGNIREQYYDSFNKIIKSDDFSMEKRTRRPPKNQLNALISFGNSLIYTTVLSEIYKTHLDPRIGYLHTTNFRSFTLNLDVAEIFKPIITDRLIFSLTNKGQLQKKHFEEEAGGILLKEAGRKIFVGTFDERLKQTIQHPSLNRKVSYRELIRLELYKLQKHLMEEQKYEPYVLSW